MEKLSWYWYGEASSSSSAAQQSIKTNFDPRVKKHQTPHSDETIIDSFAAGLSKEKPAFVPERKKDWKPRVPAEFVRDVMGSSAGAGSGEFHVYRGYRKREMIRQTYINEQAEKLDKDEEYHKKLEENQKKADDKTAKKRAKRLKQKQKMQAKKKKKEEEEKKAKRKAEGKEESSSEDESDDDDDDGEEKDDDGEENCFVIGGR